MQRTINGRFIDRYGLVDSGREYVEFTSAFQGNQAELQRAIADMRAGAFKVICVGWEHQLTRSLERAAQIERAVAEAGGWVAYSDQNKVAGSDWVSDTVHHFTNEMYSRNLSRLVASGLEEKFSTGAANGHPPLGTRHIYRRRDGSLAEGPEVHTIAVRVLDKKTLGALRALLDHYASNGSYRRTADYLNARRFRTSRGNLFTPASVKTIVLNPFYGPEEIIRYHAGEADERQAPTPPERQIFPAEIHELWLKANTKRPHSHGIKRSGPRRIYPLHSILRCSECNSDRFHGQWSRHGYRLTRHADDAPRCLEPKNVRSEDLENQVVEFLSAVEIPRDWRAQVATLRRLPDKSNERKHLEGALERLTKLHLWGDLTENEYLTQRNLLRNQLAMLPLPAETAEAYQVRVDQIRSIGGKLKRLLASPKPEGLELFREFCETAFTEIVVAGNRVTEITPASRYREVFAIGLQGCVVVRSRGLEPTPPNNSRFRSVLEPYSCSETTRISMRCRSREQAPKFPGASTTNGFQLEGGAPARAPIPRAAVARHGDSTGPARRIDAISRVRRELHDASLMCADAVQSVQSVQEVRGPWRILPPAGRAPGPGTVTGSKKRSTKRSTRAHSKRPRFSTDVHAAARVGLALDFRACMIFTTGTHGGTKPHCRTTVVGPKRHRGRGFARSLSC
jgi:DNA invertase Pin-like site-specific DNA recombinase